MAAVICAGDPDVPAILMVVNLADGKRLASWPCDPRSREWPVWLPDGGFLFANSRTPAVRVTASGAARPFPDADSARDWLPLALCPSGTQLVSARKQDRALILLNLADLSEVWRLPLRSRGRSRGHWMACVWRSGSGLSKV
jgi:hypothetical protein